MAVPSDLLDRVNFGAPLWSRVYAGGGALLGET